MIKPIRDNVLIELPPVQEKTESGVWLSKNHQRREQSGIVVLVGPEVNDNITIGTKILFENGKFRKLDHKVLDNSKEYAMVSESDIIGFFQ